MMNNGAQDIGEPEFNPILSYKPDFMSSDPEFTFSQPEGEARMVDYFGLMEIPQGTNYTGAREIFERHKADVKHVCVQNLQLISMAETVIFDQQARDAYLDLIALYGKRQCKWIELKVEKNRQQRDAYHKLNEYNLQVQKGVEHDMRRSNGAHDNPSQALITENERISREYEICKQQLQAQTDRCEEYQRVHRADQERILEKKGEVITVINWAWEELQTATRAWLEAIMFEKVAREEFLEALKTRSEPEILHTKAIHKSALKSTECAKEHKDFIFEITLKMTELDRDETKAKIKQAYESLVDSYKLENPLAREREELEESNHKEYYERMKKSIVREEFDRAAELQNWFLGSDIVQDDGSESDSVSMRTETSEKEEKEMELLEKKEAAKAKKEADKKRLARAHVEKKKEKRAAKAEQLRVEAAEKTRKEKERTEKREATKAKKEAEKMLAAKERAEKKAAKTAKTAKTAKKAKKDREEKEKRQTRAASQPVGVRKTRSSSKRLSPGLAKGGVAERLLEAVMEGSGDDEVVVKREPSLSPSSL
ncbi:hypothetical protein DFP73DRAFT_526365 [Morchella snyderi]|nr:hypothetical protein DFP73DRAFT_526365 [Morchella snyderi]